MKKIRRPAMNNKLLIILFLGIMLAGCRGHVASFKDDETPTTGKIKIAVDESYKLLLDTELYTFLSIYQDAHITPIYKPELDILKDFLDDSVQVIVTSRKLTNDEDQFLRSKTLVPRTTTVAYDALALIVNNHNPDSLIRYNDIKGIFNGSISNWHKINPKSPSNDLKVVFDNEKSGNVRYFIDRFKLPNKLPAYCYAVNSNEEVVNYVEKHLNAIGIVSVNWVSDKNDSLSNLMGIIFSRAKVELGNNTCDFTKSVKFIVGKNRSFEYSLFLFFLPC